MSVSGEEWYRRKLQVLVYDILLVPESRDAGSVVLVIGGDRNPTWSKPERETETNRDRETDKQTDRRQRHREIRRERQTDRQTLKQRQRETETPRFAFWHLPSN